MTDTQALLERLLPHFREDTIGGDDPIVHRTVVDQNDKPVGSEQICLSRLLTHEAFTDEGGSVWTAPTAYAYAMVCKAREKHLDTIEALTRERDALRELLRPFALAADDLDDKHRDDKHRDGSEIWEASAAMSILAGDLRAARAALPVINDKESV